MTGTCWDCRLHEICKFFDETYKKNIDAMASHLYGGKKEYQSRFNNFGNMKLFGDKFNSMVNSHFVLDEIDKRMCSKLTELRSTCTFTIPIFGKYISPGSQPAPDKINLCKQNIRSKP